ncbi:hypothetical protein DM860_005757 [Cuscuta australis]|uniref:DRBM domain-containing protein n=1 Tax=Cuscuta australis TaxID=267555 RepID=A0A328DW68_9ASTE|nr:hypothetical protein DM860_005757 [Cuscuta australis]
MDASRLEDVSKEFLVNELMDVLVEPHLPMRIPPGPPPLNKQESVAKQLRAVVLLYNYYHRKQYPQAEYLDFEAFCKLVVTLKPVLAWHMNCKPQSDSVELTDFEKQFSITERAIQDACNISLILDASQTNPAIEGWGISKVSVFLVDHSKEKCFLKFGLVNDGVWSVPEKDLSAPSRDSEHMNKRKRIGETSLTSEPNTSESRLQRLAFLAAQDATGLKRSDLVVLEKHIVYSLSKAKTTACFYIIQCSKPPKPDFIIPVKDTIKSLQGPLLDKSSGRWFTTPVVENFHLLPYATILSAWHLRDKTPSGLQNSISICTRDANENTMLEMGDTSIKMLGSSDNKCNNMVSEINENCDNITNYANSSSKEVGNDIASFKMGDTSIKMPDFSDNHDINAVYEINVNNNDGANYTKSSGEQVGNENAAPKMEDTSIMMADCSYKHCNDVVGEIYKNCNMSSHQAISIGEGLRNEIAHSKTGDTSIKMLDFSDNHCNSIAGEINKCYDMSSCFEKSGGVEVGNEVSSSKMGDTNIMIKDCSDNHCSSMGWELTEKRDKSTHELNDQTDDSIDVVTGAAGKEIISASKGKASVETVLGVLYKKKEALCNKKRRIEEKLALYEKSIHEVLDGREDDLTLEVKTVDKFCDEICSMGTRIQEVQDQHFVDLGSPQGVNSKINEGVAHSLQDASQELDAVCSANGWGHPTFECSSTYGGFCIKVTVQGASFECACNGDKYSDSFEARDSAAARMVSRLGTMTDMIFESFGF